MPCIHPDSETNKYNEQAERNAERLREGLMGDEAVQIKANIQRINEKVLAYGEEVIQECKTLNEAYPNGPHRPLYPILKTIQVSI